MGVFLAEFFDGGAWRACGFLASSAADFPVSRGTATGSPALEHTGQGLIPSPSPDYRYESFPLSLIPCISQRAWSPAHRGHHADTVLGSVTSVRTSVRSVKKDFFRKV